MVTRKEVAQFAGVSEATVSRVINNNGYVSNDVRARVKAAVEQLNYVPNRIARSLVKQELRQVSCITHSISNPFYGEIMQGIEEAAYESGYTLSIYNANFDKRNYERTLLEGLQDGVIVMSPVELVNKLTNVMNVVPTVVLWDWSGTPSIPHVRIDLDRAIQDAIAHLVHNGHERILFLGTESMPQAENPRYHGYMKGMSNQGLHVGQDLVQYVPKYQDNTAQGYSQIKRAVLHGVEFTAVLASNDLLAMGALRALTECGLRVPHDVSIVGVDDIEMAKVISPSLSTIRIPKREIGRTLFELLYSYMNGYIKGDKEVRFSTELIIRESTESRI